MPALRRVVKEAAMQLETGPHPERARRDAETLLLHALSKNRAWFLGHDDEEMSDAVRHRFEALLQRRMRGEPIQYILGESEFFGLRFRVTRDVLIPRPETEHLVETALQFATGWEHPRILDVGTGSGAIAVALAKMLPNARITAVDISLHGLEHRARKRRAQRSCRPDRIQARRFADGNRGSI